MYLFLIFIVLFINRENLQGATITNTRDKQEKKKKINSSHQKTTINILDRVLR